MIIKIDFFKNNFKKFYYIDFIKNILLKYNKNNKYNLFTI